jgi:D-alanine-D-alanine ligase-like ATP-grasp enzyme
VPAGRVSLQRETRSGRWIPVKRAHPTALSNNRSRYRFTVSRRSRPLSYRVVVVPNNGGANVNGRSRVVSVPKR